MDYQTKMKVRRWMRKPIVTYTFLILQFFFFIMMTVNGGSTNIYTLIRFGAKFNPLIIAGQWWRLVMPIFLHIGLMHILLNSVILYFLGIQLESFFGILPFLALYLFSGIGGNAASFAFSNAISAGASTSLFGLFGAAVALGKLYPGNYAIQSMAKRFSTLILLNIVFGLFDSSIDLAGHIGGLVAGYLLCYVLAPKGTTRLDKKERIKYGLLYGLMVVVLIGIGYSKFFFLF